MQLQEQMEAYLIDLEADEKSSATIEKYGRDIRCFLRFLEARTLRKEETLAYKVKLSETYAPASVNSMLTPLNGFLKFLDRRDCCVKLLKVQKQIFSKEEKELTKAEYLRLVEAAGDRRIGYVLRTICGTGIRISELKYVTAEAVRNGKAVVNCKKKVRYIFFPKELRKILLTYMKRRGIREGAVFVTGSGKNLDRSNVWREMKTLCKKAKVSGEKVFPHNLRHLFARTFYRLEKDIVRLADLLGHSSVNTTRIYTMESGKLHRNGIERVEKSLTT